MVTAESTENGKKNDDRKKLSPLLTDDNPAYSTKKHT